MLSPQQDPCSINSNLTPYETQRYTSPRWIGAGDHEGYISFDIELPLQYEPKPARPEIPRNI